MNASHDNQSKYRKYDRPGNHLIIEGFMVAKDPGTPANNELANALHMYSYYGAVAWQIFGISVAIALVLAPLGPVLILTNHCAHSGPRSYAVVGEIAALFFVAIGYWFLKRNLALAKRWAGPHHKDIDAVEHPTPESITGIDLACIFLVLVVFVIAFSLSFVLFYRPACLEISSIYRYVSPFETKMSTSLANGLVLAFVLPFLTAVIGGLTVVISVNYWQKPWLEVSIANNIYDGKADKHYVNLEVVNKKTLLRKLFGGGTAFNCKCLLTVDGRSFVTKWAAREPWRNHISFDPSGRPVAIPVLDAQSMEQTKFETLRPGDRKRVDVAVRMKGDSSCYVHTPENFADEHYRPKDKELRPHIYPATVFIQYDGDRTDDFHFIIRNDEGTDPGLLKLCLS